MTGSFLFKSIKIRDDIAPRRLLYLVWLNAFGSRKQCILIVVPPMCDLIVSPSLILSGCNVKQMAAIAAMFQLLSQPNLHLELFTICEFNSAKFLLLLPFQSSFWYVPEQQHSCLSFLSVVIHTGLRWWLSAECIACSSQRKEQTAGAIKRLSSIYGRKELSVNRVESTPDARSQPKTLTFPFRML